MTAARDSFWERYLGDLPARQVIPILKPGHGASDQLARLRVEIDPEVWRGVSAFCLAHEVELDASLYAATAVVLQAWYDSDEILFGMAELRGDEEARSGPVSVAPLRVGLTPEQTLVGLVEAIDRDLQERPDDDWDGALAELADVVVAIDRRGGRGAQLIEQGMTTQLVVHFDVQGLALTFVHQASEIEGDATRRLADALIQALEALSSGAGRKVAEIEVISPAERDKVLAVFNGTDRAPTEPSASTISDAFERAAAEHPDRVALVLGSQRLTYGELIARCTEVAVALRDAGVGPGVVVAVLAERSVELVVAMLAVLKAGGVYLPIDPKLPEARRLFILEDSGARLVLSQEAVAKLVTPSSTGAEDRAPHRAGETLLPRSVAYVLYTSGSTGRPKGVMIDHASLINRLTWAQRRHPLGPGDVLLHKTNIMFDVSVWELLGWILGGAALCLLEPGKEGNPRAIVAAIDRHAVTVLHFVPSMLQAFLDYVGQHPAALLTLRRVHASGEALKVLHVEQFHRLVARGRPVRLINLYGPTEATIDVSYHECEPRDAFRSAIPIGVPIDNTQLYVLDRHRNLQPLGVPGELYISGAGVGRGYLHLADLTEKRFVPDPFRRGQRMYATGDRARWHPDGYLEYLGRLDHQVKLRGFRIELQEVEAVLLRHSSIKEAVAAVQTDGAGDETLVVFLVAQLSREVDPAELRDFLGQHVPRYMIPERFVVVEHLALSPTGKVDRGRLPNAFALPSESKRPAATRRPGQGDALLELVAGVWSAVLGRDSVDHDAAFFEVGGNSLKALRVASRLGAALKLDLPVTALFRHPTIRSLATHLAERAAGTAPVTLGVPTARSAGSSREASDHEIAVIGMAGRFPGAADIDAFWENLRLGREGVRPLSEEELREAGVDEALLRNSSYVRAKGVLDRPQFLDAEFFGYSAREAQQMDPQLRLLHEVVWAALEDAGRNPESSTDAVGFFAASSPNYHWLKKIEQSADSPLSEYLLMLLNEKDFLTTRISHKLNFRGPCATVQTACSSSLAAVHYACSTLIEGRCDVAVAAGVSLTYPLVGGYLYEEGMILSPDGHCRAFDADAAGTVGGNGVAAVVLKPLKRALADGDPIHAVVKATAINNDGAKKVGFTAPSVAGQAQVIAEAQARAGVRCETIRYVEAHGTGTALGDPIEIAALREAFTTEARQFCGLGSVKTNIGHLDAASGIAGFVKTVLVVKHRLAPPSLHYKRASAELGLTESPFFVVDRPLELTGGQEPLRAGVSSFGMGGTNVHVILEEPPQFRSAADEHAWHLLPLSARSSAALAEVGTRMREHLERQPDLSLAAVATTLQTGRKAFPFRSTVVASSVADVVHALRPDSAGESPAAWIRGPEAGRPAGQDRRIAFVFPGQGSHHREMGVQLYRSRHDFRDELDACFEVALRVCGLRLGEVLYARSSSDWTEHTELVQPVLFSFEYALARLLMRWGIRPTVVMGHSLGEFVAACLSGVLSLDDALRIVTERGSLMQRSTAGRMLAVQVSHADLAAILPAELDLAAINGRESTVVAGAAPAVASFARVLDGAGHRYRYLPTSVAFHSRTMDPLLEPLEKVVREAVLREPGVSLVSSVTGARMTATEATDPRYWAQQARLPVRFSAAVDSVLAQSSAVLEVGPGRALVQLIRRDRAGLEGVLTENACRDPRESTHDVAHLLHKVGALWISGIEVDWESVRGHAAPRRVSLPAYPFESKRHWPEESRTASARPGREPDVSDWFYVPSWERTSLPRPVGLEGSRWLLLASPDSACAELAVELRRRGAAVHCAYAGSELRLAAPGEYVVRPDREEDFRQLLLHMKAADGFPTTIVHLWCLTADRHPMDVATVLGHGYGALMNLAKALGAHAWSDRLKLFAVTDAVEDVVGDEAIEPAKATLHGFTKIIALEHSGVLCRAIDVEPGGDLSGRILRYLLAESADDSEQPIVAYRGGQRWRKTHRRAPLPEPRETARIRKGGVYLVTGGLGGVGLAIAGYVVESHAGTLVLVSRQGLPPRETWEEWIEQHAAEDPLRQKMLRVRALEATGARVVVHACDVARSEEVERLAAEVEAAYGPINGIVHAAGIADYEGVIQRRSWAETERVLAPKIQGTLHLDRFVRREELDFVVLCSSIGNIVYQMKVGQSGYNAANEFLDAFAHARRSERTFWVVINWTDWKDSGMTRESMEFWSKQPAAPLDLIRDVMRDAIDDREGVEVFRRVLHAEEPHVIVSESDLSARARYVQGMVSGRGRRDELRQIQRSVPRIDVDTSGSLSSKLERILRDYLGVTEIDANANFFDTGLTSIDLAQLHSVMQRSLEAAIPQVALYDHPTIASLAAYLQSASAPAACGEKTALSDEGPRATRALERLKEAASAFRRRRD